MSSLDQRSIGRIDILRFLRDHGPSLCITSEVWINFMRGRKHIEEDMAALTLSRHVRFDREQETYTLTGNWEQEVASLEEANNSRLA